MVSGAHPAIRAIAADVDGTITDRSRHISTAAIDAIRAAEEAGVPVIIASGNVLPIAWALQRFIGTSGPVVAENGCLVSYRKRDHDMADGDVARRAFEVLRRRWDIKRLYTDQWRRNEVVFENVEFLGEIIEALEADPELSGLGIRIYDTGYGTHIVQKGVDKGVGVVKAARLLGVPLENVMAVGDAGNDVAMLEAVGFGVAVANARDQLKAVADHVTRLTYGDGFAEAVREFVLEGSR
ncbi:MAG: phosphoglycolate phosphatase [Thermoplasmata archaeon]|nr:phosphoglycolate phosphatase [Thermoplasmata archaeon]